jgi:ribonuclease BN (tRNA processing enzyme)
MGCSPAWPNPGGAQSGYLVESDGRRLLLDCGPGVLARLRERETWPRVEAIAITHWHLDHWGDIVPWVWGQTLGPGVETKNPELWIPPGGVEMLEAIGARLGRPEMFASAFGLHEYVDGEPFETAGFQVTPKRVLHYEMLAFGFRTSANGTENADLFVCEATLMQPNPEGGTRGHLASDEALEAFEAAGAKRLLLTHRPTERPLDAGLEQAHDGMELVVDDETGASN